MRESILQLSRTFTALIGNHPKGGAKFADEREVRLAVIGSIEDVKFLANETNTPKTIGTLQTLGAAHEIMARYTPIARIKVAALMAILAIGYLSTIRTAVAVIGMGATMAQATVFAEHTLGA